MEEEKAHGDRPLPEETAAEVLLDSSALRRVELWRKMEMAVVQGAGGAKEKETNHQGFSNAPLVAFRRSSRADLHRPSEVRHAVSPARALVRIVPRRSWSTCAEKELKMKKKRKVKRKRMDVRTLLCPTGKIPRKDGQITPYCSLGPSSR